MTPDEMKALDRELAVGMGWKWEGGFNAHWHKTFTQEIVMRDDWHPATDIVQAFEVVDWLIGKGWDFSVSIKTGSLWYALFEQYPTLDPHIGAWHEKRSLAICLAAREVMRI